MAVPLLQAGMSYEQIAPVFGKTPETIRRWANHPDVKAALGEIADAAREVTRSRAEELVEKAWRTLEDLMDNAEDERVRADASKTVLSRCGHPEATKTEAKTEHSGAPALAVVLTAEQAKGVAR